MSGNISGRFIDGIRKGLWLSLALSLTMLLVLGCRTPAQPAAPESAGDAAAQPTQAAPTPTPRQANPPDSPQGARDLAVVITEAEPASVGAWSEGCTAEIHSLGCQEFVTDYLTWLDDNTNEIVPLSSVESWEQQDLDRWRFYLREGVAFHNGAPWNADAAKYGIDYSADPTNSTTAVQWTGVGITSEVIDEFTFDVICPQACPIFPRTALFTAFQDPAWYESASESERSQLTVGLGPYRIIEHSPGVHTRFEAYADYKPNDNWFSRAPDIPYITHVYRPEPAVRSSMVQTGEADWAADIGFEEILRVPNHAIGKTSEVYTLVLDTVFHPELSKQQVRLALAHAIDCQSLLDSLFGGRIPCHGAISMKGTVGINDANSQVRQYDPDLARQLLAEAGYDPANEINIHTRPGSNIKGMEIVESTVNFWREVGVNANLNVWSDLGKAREVQISGCGQFAHEPGYDEAMDCADRDPPGPFFQSSHAYEVATSNEILDMQRFNNARLTCFSRISRVCDQELEAVMVAANSLPEGPDRTAAMEAIGQIAYDEVYFIPFFEVVYVYGMSDDLEWEPYYAPRLRGNTMRFK